MDYLIELRRRRRENLRRLLCNYPTQRDFSEATGVAVAQISHILTGFREMGDVIARQIEGALSLPMLWMDQPVDGGNQVSESSVISMDERKLLDSYRYLSAQHKDLVMDLTLAYCKIDKVEEIEQKSQNNSNDAVALHVYHN